MPYPAGTVVQCTNCNTTLFRFTREVSKREYPWQTAESGGLEAVPPQPPPLLKNDFVCATCGMPFRVIGGLRFQLPGEDASDG